MSKCEDCKHCNLDALKKTQWYCKNAFIVILFEKHELPFDSVHDMRCFELWEGMEK